MPNEYKLKFTPIASDDLDEIYSYLVNKEVYSDCDCFITCDDRFI